ncbi:MAG TPA: DNA alkylation repair protein, partial [Candidatus Sumerlaeota bacterium]|nr:DNA alkylation repair protein [Candidatus Sumerlaeota bacterium]
MKECSARELQRAIRAQGNKERAKAVGVFFKTGKGQYAEGDIFLGLTVPQVRAAIRPYRQLPLREVDVLLASKYH